MELELTEEIIQTNLLKEGNARGDDGLNTDAISEGSLFSEISVQSCKKKLKLCMHHTPSPKTLTSCLKILKTL